MCQVWLKYAQWFWRRRFKNFVNVFSLFLSYLPLKRGGTLPLNKLESPSPKNALCKIWLEFAWWFWRRKFFKLSQRFWRRRRKFEKFATTPTTTTTTDNGQFTRYFGTGELKMFKGVEVVRKSSASASTDIVLYYRRFHRHKDCINRFPIESVHTAQNENFMF